MDPLNLTFHNGDVLPAEQLNEVTGKIDEIVSVINTGGQGSNVQWDQFQTEGVNIAKITINGNEQLVYAPEGEQGPQGEQGPKGDKGDTGEQGPQGEQGVQGVPGADGKSLEFIWGTGTNENQLGVRQEGQTNYTFSNSLKGDTGATGSIGPQGPAGPTGPTGADGKNLEFIWGTGANENQLGVRKEGDQIYIYSNNLKGDTGEQGPKGDKGDTGDPGIETGVQPAQQAIGTNIPQDATIDASPWQKCGDYVTFCVRNAHCIKGWHDIAYHVPFAPLPGYGATGYCYNDRGDLVCWNLSTEDGHSRINFWKYWQSSDVFAESGLINIVITYKYK